MNIPYVGVQGAGIPYVWFNNYQCRITGLMSTNSGHNVTGVSCQTGGINGRIGGWR
jgi:hypothetical protein